jgi:hypothetical protein
MGIRLNRSIGRATRTGSNGFWLTLNVINRPLP